MNQYDVLTVPRVTALSVSLQPVSVSYTRLFSSLLAVGVVLQFCLWPRLNLWFLHNKDPYSVPAWPCLPSSFLLHCQVDTLPTFCSEVAHIVAARFLQIVGYYHSSRQWLGVLIPGGCSPAHSHVPLLSLSHR